MDVDSYLEIRDLFHPKWDAVILAALAEHPHRFLALARTVRSRTHGDLTDRTVARSLDRLQDLGYVCADFTRCGQRQVPLYSLTRLGAATLEIYEVMVSAYQQTREPPERERATS